MMRVVVSLFGVAASAALVASCSGSEANAHHEGVEHGSTAKPAAAAATLTPAQQAYKQAAEQMHAGMMGAIPADPDVAFAQGMIPHHQGAIDMARVQLQYGQDPEMRKLAQEVIAAQEAEIARLNAFLAKRGATSAAAPAQGAVDHSAMGH